MDQNWSKWCSFGSEYPFHNSQDLSYHYLDCNKWILARTQNPLQIFRKCHAHYLDGTIDRCLGGFWDIIWPENKYLNPFGMIRMDSDVMCVIFRARATKPFRSMLGKLGTWSSRNEISRREHALGQNKVSRVSNLWYLELNLARIWLSPHRLGSNCCTSLLWNRHIFFLFFENPGLRDHTSL